MRIYLTGSDGMLGTALAAVFRSDTEHPVRGVSVRDFDIADEAALRRSMDGFEPDVVIHTAAHAVVDDCEVDPALAMRVNVEGVRNVARECRQRGVKLVHLSSDYVFAGDDPPPGGYVETDVPGPVSVYGLTKLAGEAIAATVPDHVVVRTSWLFGGADERTDVVLATARAALRGRSSALVCDQYGSPTYTVDLAEAIRYLLVHRPATTGVVHIVNGGAASWYEVGETLIDALGPDGIRAAPTPRPMAECGFVGKRPRRSALCTDRLTGLGHRMPGWPDAIARFAGRLVAEEGSHV